MREDNLLIAGFIAVSSAIMSLYNGLCSYQTSRTRKVNQLLLLVLSVAVCAWGWSQAAVLMDNAPAGWQLLAVSALCIFGSVFWQFFIHLADRCGWLRGQTIQSAASNAEIEDIRERTAVLEVCKAALQQEVKESRAALAQIEYHANYDYLTGLPNRRRCYEEINQAITGPDHRELAVMFLDLDDFKVLNDSLGHACGDLALKQVVDRIRVLLCPAVTLARIGGDEFLILLYSDSGQQVAALAETIANSIRQLFMYPFCIDNCRSSLSVSIGIAVYPQHGLDADTLIRNADMAMYAAKNNGKNRYRFYAADMERRNHSSSGGRSGTGLV